MNKNLYIHGALEAGFDYAAVMETKDMVFDSSLRRYCEENLCGNYGKNYGCPPDCGTPGQMKKKVGVYRYALVLQSMYTVTDYHDHEQIKRTKHIHNQMSKNFIKTLEDSGTRGLTMLAGPCSGCADCLKISGLPCSRPEARTSCLSAYCVNVSAMAEHCHIPYWCEDGKVAYFSVWLFG